MTILFDRRSHGELDGYICRLNSLLDHLKRLRAGELPAATELAAAPILDHYAPFTRPVTCLAGQVQGHPRVAAGPIMTSELWVHAPDLGFARTLGRVYRLGRPAGLRDRQCH